MHKEGAGCVLYSQQCVCVGGWVWVGGREKRVREVGVLSGFWVGWFVGWATVVVGSAVRCNAV